MTHIGKTAFQNFGIDSITLSSTVEDVGPFSVQGNNITSVDLKNVVMIGEGAFYENKLLTSVVIPSTVKTIGDYAFDLCIALESVDTSEATSLVTIGKSAFVASSIKDFYVPATVTSLGTGAFVECYSLNPSMSIKPMRNTST